LALPVELLGCRPSRCFLSGRKQVWNYSCLFHEGLQWSYSSTHSWAWH